jgi:putative Mg2+ transporter-C (MgtC) family protein
MLADLIDFNWQFALDNVVRIGIAYVLALPIGWDREFNERTAGLRTFPLVSVAACAYTIAGIHFLDSTDAESRVLQGLITGMGFIGGGAILKEGGNVTGTATAAGLWAAGAIGMATAMGLLELATVLAFVTFLTFRLLAKAKKARHSGNNNGN